METGILYVVFNEAIRNPETNERLYNIGTTKNFVHGKFDELSLKIPGKFEMLFAYRMQDYQEAEQIIQRILKKRRENGGWFTLSEKQLDLIKVICEEMGGELVTDEVEQAFEAETDEGETGAESGMEGDSNVDVMYTEEISLLVNQGNAYFKAKDYKKVVKYYGEAIQKAVGLNLDAADLYFKRGIVCFNDGDYKPAIQDFNQACSLKPDNAEYYYWKGNACFYDKQYGAAIAALEKALEKDPGNSNYQKRLDEAKRGKTEFEGSIPVEVPPDIFSERLKNLKPLLEEALRKNETRGIRFGKFMGGTKNPKATYVIFGTKSMDNREEQSGIPGTKTWCDGHKYCYAFDFNYRDSMTASFWLAPKNQNIATREIMENVYRKYHNNATPHPNSDRWRVFSFDLNINVKIVFSPEQVRTEVNKTIDAILKWEKSFPFERI